MKKEKTNSKKKDSEAIINSLQEKIEKLEEDNRKIFVGWQRTEADYINYKSKEFERLEELSVHIKEDLLDGLLPIMDNFELAERMIPEEKKNDNNIKGLLMIKKQFSMFLESLNIKEIEVMGKLFDPHYHEVVEEIEVEEKQSGEIVEEVQKGYVINNKVARPAKVKIVK